MHTRREEETDFDVGFFHFFRSFMPIHKYISVNPVDLLCCNNLFENSRCSYIFFESESIWVIDSEMPNTKCPQIKRIESEMYTFTT